MTFPIVSFAFMESLCIYGLVIALAILFANTTHASHGSVHPCPPASALALCISLPLYLAIFWVASWALEVSPVAHAVLPAFPVFS